jgi:hypothetical protein
LGCGVVAGSLAGCGGGAKKKPSPAERRSEPGQAVTPGLALGITEPNPALLWSRKDHPDDGPFGPWRDKLAALRPALYRLSVDWAALQPSPDRPPDWTMPANGCVRDIGPCAPYAGIRDELRAVRSAQQAVGGFQVVVVLYGVPAWAAQPAGGCERPGIQPRSRPITDAGLDAYRRLIRSLLELARSEHVALPWWSPWNEPNGPFFISPQRESCARDSRLRSPDVYARLARALKAELDAAPGDQRLVIGELAGFRGARRFGASIAQFVGALPDDVVCSAAVYAQHAYAQRGDRVDDPGPVGELERTLDRRPCARGKRIWVTETGVGGAHAGDSRSSSPAALKADCRALAATLDRWRRDPRVAAAIQYTFRDDPVFPVGLADASLTRAWPAYDVWLAQGQRGPAGTDPPLPPDCR